MFKRQGDILFEKTQNTNLDLRARRDDGVIAQGETTGHAHVLQGGALRHLGGGGMAAVTPDGGRVTHEEHDTIELEPGVWLIHRQNEYVGKGETQQVWD